MINVLQGSCFGGSTVVNTADCEPTPEPVYEHWRRRYGLDLDARELADAQSRVFEMLGVRPIDASQVNRNNAIVLEGARKLGWRAGTFQNNRTDCIGSGYCLIGCAYDAKKGAHLNYLPRAVEAGATIYTDVRIERVVASEGGGFRATGAVVARGPRTARLPFEVQAERVVLAAGAVHSAAILDASGFARGRPALARNVSLQPQMSVAASMPEAVVAWRGIPQSAFCSEFDDNTPERGLGGFRFEAISGGLSQVAAGLRGFGHAHKETMAHAREGALALLLVPDEPSGTLRFTRGERGFRAHDRVPHDRRVGRAPAPRSARDRGSLVRRGRAQRPLRQRDLRTAGRRARPRSRARVPDPHRRHALRLRARAGQLPHGSRPEHERRRSRSPGARRARPLRRRRLDLPEQRLDPHDDPGDDLRGSRRAEDAGARRLSEDAAAPDRRVAGAASGRARAGRAPLTAAQPSRIPTRLARVAQW